MRLESMERMNLTLSAGAVAASFALAPPQFAWSVAAGAALEALNFGVMLRSARELFRGEIQGGAGWVGLFGLRFALLAPAIVIALWAGAHPVGLVAGLSVAMPAVVFGAWRSRPPVLEVDPALVVPADDPSWDRWSVWRVREVAPRDEFGDPIEEDPIEEEDARPQPAGSESER